MMDFVVFWFEKSQLLDDRNSMELVNSKFNRQTQAEVPWRHRLNHLTGTFWEALQ